MPPADSAEKALCHIALTIRCTTNGWAALYGEKASQDFWFSALSLAKKAQQEFETAIRLDKRNFSALPGAD